ncbi:MAG: AmmeMemoRadiSam system radical SAM enzyme [candidate division Zixibacteria bacterium]|nr:AmmeMemoRadiSam system radical SAM enzyme [candidate division Zixibacteria bacterium]
MLEPGVVRGNWWHRLDDGRVQCDLCPRLCKLHEDQRGFCFVRQERDGGISLTAYGRASGFCIDPIEKKPLNHFYPGTSVLSFGTAGCNLGCRFCQNWDISKSRETARLSEWAAPMDIAATASRTGCRSIAFTYNDPVIFAEYAIDSAVAAHDLGLKTVAVTAGYIMPEARRAFFAHMDAANVDLKAFTETFYHKLCFAALTPVLDTLVWLKRETDVWIEVTTLLIPGQNDSEDEIARLCDWFVEHLGPETPLHVTAFHPDFRMTGIAATPASTLSRARRQAKAAGLHHVYTGNVYDAEGQSTYCAGCGVLLIERNGYHLGKWNLGVGGKCNRCGVGLSGHFDAAPGDWGPRRQPVRV